MMNQRYFTVFISTWTLHRIFSFRQLNNVLSKTLKFNNFLPRSRSCHAKTGIERSRCNVATEWESFSKGYFFLCLNLKFMLFLFMLQLLLQLPQLLQSLLSQSVPAGGWVGELSSTLRTRLQLWITRWTDDIPGELSSQQSSFSRTGWSDETLCL